MMNLKNCKNTNSRIFLDDMSFLINRFDGLVKESGLLKKEFKILVTGGTGLIGNYILALLSKVVENGYKLKIYSLSRHDSSDFARYSNVKYFKFDLSLERFEPNIEFDYIIHLASPTSSKFFCDHPVTTIDSIICGTRNVLQYLLKHKKTKMIYLSSMEVYGDSPKGCYSEDKFDGLDPFKVRSSYPEAKRLCECLCKAYNQQYSLNISIGRLTQTFGPGMQLETDTRFFSSLIKSAVSGNTLYLYSNGETKRCYIYLADAVYAIFVILFKDTIGQVYNIANPITFKSIMDIVIETSKYYGFNYEIKLNDTSSRFFCKPHELNLDVAKLMKFSWKPSFSLENGIKRTVDYYTCV